MQNFYNVSSSEDGLIYNFTTRFNIEYNLVLTAYQMGDVRTFSLALYPEKEPHSFDYWVKNTVIKIISDFLKLESNVVFYVCDGEDNKEDQRHRVFEYWYEKEIELHEFIAKYNFSIQSKEGYKVNSSILYNRENYLSEYIISQFEAEMKLF